MRMPWLVAAVLAVATPVAAGSPITGEYVEARTAEVFTGGCIMSSEAETIGRQAVMAWHINHGAFNGVALDGLNVIAAVAGDRNLGIREIGGVAPTAVRAAVIVDSRGSSQQRDALVAFVRQISSGLIDEIVERVRVAGDVRIGRPSGPRRGGRGTACRHAPRASRSELRCDAMVPSAGLCERSVHRAHGSQHVLGPHARYALERSQPALRLRRHVHALTISAAPFSCVL